MRRTRAWRRDQTARISQHRWSELKAVMTSDPWVLTCTPHRWHKHTPFNCGNKGCLVCSPPMHGAELRVYRYRKAEVDAWDFDPEFDEFFDYPYSLYDRFHEDEREFEWQESMYNRDTDDWGGWGDWAPNGTWRLSDELWLKYEQRRGFWDPDWQSWNEEWDLDTYAGYHANLEAMVAGEVDDRVLYIPDEDEEAA